MTALTPGTTTGDTDLRLLRVAVPNKGSLSEPATEMLRESGYRQRSDSKQLTLVDAENGVEFFYLRPRDIALYVGEGTLDVGVTGRDLLADSGAKAEEALQLGFGRSRFHFAGPAGRFSDVADLAGMRIALILSIALGLPAAAGAMAQFRAPETVAASVVSPAKSQARRSRSWARASRATVGPSWADFWIRARVCSTESCRCAATSARSCERTRSSRSALRSEASR